MHGHLAGSILLELGILQVDVVLDRLAGERNLLVYSFAVLRHESPVTDGKRNKQDNDEEDIGLEAGAPRNKALHNEGNNQVECGEVDIRESS